MGLLTHINRRLKPVEAIQLPVEDLIRQVNDTSLSCFVTVSFYFIYNKIKKLIRNFQGYIDNSNLYNLL